MCRQKEKLKIKKNRKLTDFGGFQSPEVKEKKKSKYRQIFTVYLFFSV
jgi:hypothetical protein